MWAVVVVFERGSYEAFLSTRQAWGRSNWDQHINELGRVRNRRDIFPLVLHLVRLRTLHVLGVSGKKLIVCKQAAVSPRTRTKNLERQSIAGPFLLAPITLAPRQSPESPSPITLRTLQFLSTRYPRFSHPPSVSLLALLRVRYLGLSLLSEKGMRNIAVYDMAACDFCAISCCLHQDHDRGSLMSKSHRSVISQLWAMPQ